MKLLQRSNGCSAARARNSSSPRALRTGAPPPTRAYIDELLPEVMEGRIDPRRVFDRTVDLDGVPDGYRAMNDREALKVLIRP